MKNFKNSFHWHLCYHSTFTSGRKSSTVNDLFFFRLRCSTMLFACLLTHEQAFLCPEMEISVQSPGRIAPCDGRPSAPAPLSELARGGLPIGGGTAWAEGWPTVTLSIPQRATPMQAVGVCLGCGSPLPCTRVLPPSGVGRFANCGDSPLLSNVLTLPAT